MRGKSINNLRDDVSEIKRNADGERPPEAGGSVAVSKTTVRMLVVMVMVAVVMIVIVGHRWIYPENATVNPVTMRFYQNNVIHAVTSSVVAGGSGRGWAAGRDFRSKTLYSVGRIKSVSNVELTRPPITTAASGF